MYKEVVFLSDLSSQIPDHAEINASSIGKLAIERFKLAMALDPDDPQTANLREELIENA